MAKSPPLKRFPVEGTASGAVEGAASDLGELRDELQEALDNTPERLQETERYTTLQSTQEELDSIVGDLEGLDFPESVSELAASWTENRRKGTSRSDRRDNCTNALSAAKDALDVWAADEANEEHEDRDAVDQLISDLEDIVSRAEGCEFPGQRG